MIKHIYAQYFFVLNFIVIFCLLYFRFSGNQGQSGGSGVGGGVYSQMPFSYGQVSKGLNIITHQSKFDTYLMPQPSHGNGLALNVTPVCHPHGNFMSEPV